VGSREIFNFYEDVVSGATKERKALDQLMEDANTENLMLCWCENLTGLPGL
jgi:DNA invertase Pin-like site-specific DNA recombinase